MFIAWKPYRDKTHCVLSISNPPHVIFVSDSHTLIAMATIITEFCPWEVFAEAEETVFTTETVLSVTEGLRLRK